MALDKAVYFYNLIPSCSNCNLRKYDSSDEIIYPYKEEFGEKGKFNYDVNDISIFYENKNLDGLPLYFDINDCEIEKN